MNKCCLFLIFLLIVSATNASDDYSVSKIPLALLKNAHVVKRLETTTFEIINTGEAVLVKKYALTILNENGDEHAGLVEYYDKIHSIREIEGVLYDSRGNQIKKLKGKDIIDVSGVDDNNLIDDHRRKIHHFYHKIYPYTVEYTVATRYKGTLFFPTWNPREDENFAVQQSSITIVFPASYSIRYRAFNYTGEPAVAQEKNRKQMTWEVKDLPAMETEYACPSWYELNTVVFFGPSAFEIEDYKGNMDSWADFGKFVYSLTKGKDVLPDKVKQEVSTMVSGTTDVQKKIAILYEYLQKNTRYISIQLGIGGWEPFDAKFVASKAYGDCKALTNYMYSLLKEAGITSYYTLIKAGRSANRVLDDFPSQQFNHVILCVPLQKDTVWLECTSQTMPAGYLGDFTCDRYALLVDEKGGHLVRTPKYNFSDNTQIRYVNGKLEADGTLGILVKTRYAGLQQDHIHGLINNLSNEKVKQYLQGQLDFATYDINRFNYKEEKSTQPAIDEDLEITVSNYATITGKRLFILPNVMTRTSRKLTANPDRKYEMVLGFEYLDIDTVIIELPAGFEKESVPASISIAGKFGKYAASTEIKNDRLYYYRHIEQYSGRFPSTDYAELVKFYEAIYKADRTRVVLVRNELPLKAF